MIRHSKRNYLLLGWILFKVVLQYKISQKPYGILSTYNPRLDNLEATLRIYADNPLILKCKNHLSYRLGVALICAHKTWYKGGYIKFFKEVKKIKAQFKSQNYF